MQLEGKNAIVTGAGQGIGKAIALEMARRGSDVASLQTRANRDAKVLQIFEGTNQIQRMIVARDYLANL